MAQLQGGGMVAPKKPIVGGALVGAVAGQAAPMDQINALLASYGAPIGGEDIDYYAQAQQAYEPQFDYLDSLQKQSEGRVATGTEELKKLYASLQSQISQQAGGIKSNYDTSIKGVNIAYGNALGNVKQGFDSSRNGLAETLQRLGIQEAAPSAVGKQSAMQALLQGALGANQMAATTALGQGKQSALTFNTQQQNAAGLAGAEAQKGLRGKLEDFISQLNGRRADISTQVNNSAMGMEQSAQKSAYDQFADERDFNYQMAKDKAANDLAYAKLAGGGAESPKLDPLGQVQQLANTLYGNEQGANNAVKAVTDAIQAMSNEGEEVSYASLMAKIKQRLQQANGRVGDQGNLERIASLLYNQMY